MFEAVHAEVDDPENLQEYEALNMKKKTEPEGLEKEAIDVQKINEKSAVCFWWAVITCFIILTWWICLTKTAVE